MNLQQLTVYRNYDNTVKGSIQFKNELGKIEYALDEAACAAVVAVCGKELERITRRAAEEMSAKVFDLKPALAAPDARNE